MFSKSKRFPYSEESPRYNPDNPQSPTLRFSNNHKIARRVERPRARIINPKYIKDSLESLNSGSSPEIKDNSKGTLLNRNLRRKEDVNVTNSTNNSLNESVPQHPLSQFIISTNNEIKRRNTIKKIAKGVKNTFMNNIFSKNVYNVRKEELKQNVADKPDLNTTFNIDSFGIDLNDVKETEKQFQSDEKWKNPRKKDKSGLKINNKEDDDDDDSFGNVSEIDRHETARTIEEIVACSTMNINSLLQDSLLKIKENSNRKFKCFLAEIVAFSVYALEEVQEQCFHVTEDTNTRIRNLLKNSLEKQATKENALKMTNLALSAKLNDVRMTVNNMERKYIGMLEDSKSKIVEQEMMIDTLKAEVDALELSTTMEKVLRKQKKKQR